MFVKRKSRTIFFPSDTLIFRISRDGSKNFNIRTCEHMILGQLTMGAHQTKMHPCLWAAPDVLQNFSFKSFICGGGENWVTKVHLYICMPGVCFVFSLKWGFAVKYPGQLPGASNEQLEHTGWKKIIREEDKKRATINHKQSGEKHLTPNNKTIFQKAAKLNICFITAMAGRGLSNTIIDVLLKSWAIKQWHVENWKGASPL